MRLRTESVAFALLAVAIVPYVLLKVLWLAGSTVGLRSAAAVEQMHSGRMVVGNNVTIVLELLAVLLALAFTRPWGRRIPAWVVLGLGAGATGLLAPVLLGVPLGSLLQLAIDGSVQTEGMAELSPWEFAVVYSGFGLLAVVLAMLWWGVAGPGETGPQGMDAVVQRVPLAVAGTLALVGFLAPLLACFARRPHLAWLLVWTGCTTAALQGPTALGLANEGLIAPVVLALALVTTPGSAVYGLAVLHARRRELLTAEDASVLGVPQP